MYASIPDTITRSSVIHSPQQKHGSSSRSSQVPPVAIGETQEVPTLREIVMRDGCLFISSFFHVLFTYLSFIFQFYLLYASLIIYTLTYWSCIFTLFLLMEILIQNPRPLLVHRVPPLLKHYSLCCLNKHKGNDLRNEQAIKRCVTCFCCFGLYFMLSFQLGSFN